MTDATTAQDSFILYGIKNCDTVRKARRYLTEQESNVTFHDFRQDGIDASLLDSFIEQLGITALLNTRGTTWRKLPESERYGADQPAQARQLMLDQPAIIKRPVLVRADGSMLVGFDIARWESFLQEVK